MRRRSVDRKLTRVLNWVWNLLSFMGLAATVLFVGLYQAGFFEYLHHKLPDSLLLKFIAGKLF